MTFQIGRWLKITTFAIGTTSLISSCSAFKIGNPFLPAARVLVTTSPNVLNSVVTYTSSTQQFTYQNDTPTFTLSAYPGDITPGVHFTDYSLSFYDQQGTPISDALIPPRQMQIDLYMPRGMASAPGTIGGTTGTTTGGTPGTTGTGGSGQINIPVLDNTVCHYAVINGFRNVGTDASPSMVINTAPWSQSITGKVTFYGQDDDQYPVQAQGTFTVNFQTAVQ